MIETVWELKVYFNSKSSKVTNIVDAELKEIKVAEGFFKTEPYISGKGIGYMKRTKKEAIATISKQLKKREDLPLNLAKLKQMMIEEFPELVL